MGIRLISLTLVPIAALGLHVGGDVARQRREAAKAADVARRVEHLVELVQLETSVRGESSLAEAIAGGDEFGVDRATLSDLLKLDVVGEFGREAALVDERASEMAGSADFDAAIDAMHSVRAHLSIGAVARDRVVASYRPVQDLVHVAAIAEIDAIAAAAGHLHAEGSVGGSVEALRTSLDLLASFSHQTRLLFEGLTSSGAAREQTRLDLSGVITEVNRANATLGRLLPPTGLGREALTEVRSRDEAVVLQRALAAFLAPEATTEPLTTTQAASLSDVFGRALVLDEAYEKVVDATGRDAVVEMINVRRSAFDQVRSAVMAAAIALVASVVGATLLVRSLRRPLRRLEATATAIIGGAISVDPLPDRGPRELRVASRAINELVENLATVERQAHALATANLADVSLGQPANGALGTWLHATFRRLRDVMREQAALREQLAHDAAHDPLTGLLNRAGALEALHGALSRAERAGVEVAALFVDLDGFKDVNDEFGHAVGDAVLRATAQRIRATIRAGSSVARLGGDEFLVVLEAAQAAEEAAAIGDRLLEALCKPVVVDGLVVRIGASIGVATAGRADAVDEVMRNADIALYRAKANGKARVETFAPPRVPG